MVYIGVLWNTINHLRDDVIADIGKHGEVLSCFEYELNEKYDMFVKELYQLDGIAEWKVNLKLEAMNLTSNKNIIIVLIKIDDSKKEFNNRKNKVVAVNVENLKNTIRTKYSKVIPNYFFDNVFHMTDNEEELKGALEVLQKWFPEVCIKYQEIIDGPEKLMKRERKKNEDK